MGTKHASRRVSSLNINNNMHLYRWYEVDDGADDDGDGCVCVSGCVGIGGHM